MYTLYWDRRTRAASVQMLLEEAGIPYQRKTIELAKGKHLSPEFLAINPKGFVPTLVTETGDVITETGAMLLHISDAHDTKGLVPEPNDPMRGQFLDWFFYHLTVLQAPYKRFYFARRYTTETTHQAGVVESAVHDMTKHWNHVESHLKTNGPYHLGDRFTLNDILLVTYATFQSWNKNFFEDYPAVAHCYNQAKQRPALRTIIEEHEAQE